MVIPARIVPPPGAEMNRFEREFWDGAREAALTVYDAVKDRADVPEDVRTLARELLEETGAQKNREFREKLGIPAAH